MAVAVDTSATRYSDLCRLCATKIGIIHGLNIFATDANYRQILKKIEACLPIHISESDVLPKMVCENCVYKVELLFDFRERALHTESVLIELFKQLHHPIQLHNANVHHHSQHLKLDVVLDSTISSSSNLLNDGLGHVHDIDLPQLSHRESMIILSQHNVPLDQLSQHDINQELSNHSIDGPDAAMLVGANSYNAIDYQHHHILAEDLNLHTGMHAMKSIDHQDAFPTLNELNHGKSANMSVGGVQKLMMNEAHFMHDHLNDDNNIDSLISSYFCNICTKSFDGKALLEEHYQEHYTKMHYPQEKVVEQDDATSRKEILVAGAPVCCPPDLNVAQIAKELSDQQQNDETSAEGFAHAEKCLMAFERLAVQNAPVVSEDVQKKTEPYSDESDYFEARFEEEDEDQSHSSKKMKVVENGKKKNLTPKTCSICGKEYKTNYKLTEHMRRHTGEQPFKCQSCDKAFRSKIGLAQHEATHTGEFDFSCKTCGKGFQCKSYLMVHQRVHSDVKPFPCTTCERSFKTKQSLLDHTNRHLGVKPFACEMCKRSFITAGLLRAHQKTHQGTDNRKHKCPVCNKMFVSKSYLQTHSKIHTGEKPYKCDVCGKGFLARVDLKIHSTMHTGEKSWVCEMCGKAFARRDALRCHVRSHTGERPYKCDICGQTFTQFSPMAIHKRFHTGERPYECAVCGEKFVSKSTMMVHFKKHDKS